MTIFVHGAGVMAASGSHLVPDDDICDLLMSDVFQALKAYYKLPQTVEIRKKRCKRMEACLIFRTFAPLLH